MRTLTILFFSLLGSGLLAQVPLSPAPKLQLKGMVTIHIEYPSASTNVPVSAYVLHSFPSSTSSEVKDSLSAVHQEVWLNCPVRIAQEGSVWIDGVKLQTFMMPGDTIHIHVNSIRTDSEKPELSVSFNGITKQVQEYYLAKNKQFGSDFHQTVFSAGCSARTLSIAQSEVDRMTQIEQPFWKSYQQSHSLPSWFVRHETDAMRYRDGFMRMYLLFYVEYMQKKKQTVPPTYFAFLKNLPLRNKAAQFDLYYLDFTNQYISWKAKSMASKEHKIADFTSAASKAAEQILGPDLGGYFRLWYRSSYLSLLASDLKKDLAVMKFPATYRYLTDYLTELTNERLKNIPPGSKAPNFYLSDTRDSLVSLSQFRGKLVYLCFWSVGCRGCLEAFPAENQLVKEFAGQPVEIISICTSSEQPQKWRELIQKAKLKPVSLLANKAWTKSLVEKYAIQAFPRYVLVGPDGNIIENFASHPGKVSAQIRTSLAKLGR